MIIYSKKGKYQVVKKKLFDKYIEKLTDDFGEADLLALEESMVILFIN